MNCSLVLVDVSWLGAEVCGPGFRLEKAASYFSNFLAVEEAAALSIAQFPRGLSEFSLESVQPSP